MSKLNFDIEKIIANSNVPRFAGNPGIILLKVRDKNIIEAL